MIRASMGVDLRGSVIIFDEGHNIEDTARWGSVPNNTEGWQGSVLMRKHWESAPVPAPLQCRRRRTFCSSVHDLPALQCVCRDAALMDMGLGVLNQAYHVSMRCRRIIVLLSAGTRRQRPWSWRCSTRRTLLVPHF